MADQNPFEQASREKFRFPTPIGSLIVEDLWEIPLTGPSNRVHLDGIALGLYHQLREDDTASFVTKNSRLDPQLQAKFELVKHIIDVRLAERTEAEAQKVKAEKKQKLLGILRDREDESLRSLPIDELRKALEEL